MNKTVLKTCFWTTFSDSLIVAFEASRSTFYNARCWKSLTESRSIKLQGTGLTISSHMPGSAHILRNHAGFHPRGPTGIEYGFDDLSSVKATYLKFN